ncbi:hypothetical protein CBER1_08651 [Cercospora berteroae]|uniref:Uncharacterized protein n=1 Tax=Cercospora berteroae TaxID=357750 RepID=A0A2S6BVR1_9PEZI|nr:hypothetical protein CBER1_08651 [Cercospora berteroae]
MFKAAHQLDDRISERKWLLKEAKGRTATWLSLLDCAFLFFRGIPTRILTSEITYDLPSTETAFEAEHHFALPQFSFRRAFNSQEAFQQLFLRQGSNDTRTLDLTVLDTFILIHMLYRYTSDVLSLSLCRAFSSESEALTTDIRHALDTWQKCWKHLKTHAQQQNQWDDMGFWRNGDQYEIATRLLLTQSGEPELRLLLGSHAVRRKVTPKRDEFKMPKTSANKERGAAKKLSSAGSTSDVRKRKRAGSVSDASTHSDSKDSKLENASAQPSLAPRKRARVSPQAKMPTEGKQRARKTKQDRSEELVDMTGWISPISQDNSSSMWRPKNKAREEEIALGPSVYAVVKAERAARRSSTPQSHVDSVDSNASSRRSPKGQKPNAEEAGAAREAEKASIADMIVGRGLFASAKIGPEFTALLSAYGILCPFMMSNGEIYDPISAWRTTSTTEIQETSCTSAPASGLVIGQIHGGCEKMLRTHPNRGSWRAWEDEVEKVHDAQGDVDELSL